MNQQEPTHPSAELKTQDLLGLICIPHKPQQEYSRVTTQQRWHGISTPSSSTRGHTKQHPSSSSSAWSTVSAETHEKHHVPLRGLFILVAWTEGGLTKRSISHKGRVSFPKVKNRGTDTAPSHVAHLLVWTKGLTARKNFKPFYIYPHKTKQYQMNGQTSKYDTWMCSTTKVLCSNLNIWMIRDHFPICHIFLAWGVQSPGAQRTSSKTYSLICSSNKFFTEGLLQLLGWQTGKKCKSWPSKSWPSI